MMRLLNMVDKQTMCANPCVKSISAQDDQCCAQGANVVVKTQRLHKGFTLVETLVSLMILVILTGIVAMGVPMAFNAYAKVVTTSNAQTLLTTATTELRNELGLASHVRTNSGEDVAGTVDYIQVGQSYTMRIDPATDANNKSIIVVKKYSTAATPAAGDSAMLTKPLVTESAMTAELSLEFTRIDYKPGIFVVKGLKVKSKDGAQELASVEDYEIKAALMG